MERAFKDGVPLPDRIQNAPILTKGLELYYAGFMDLMASRQTGFGIGPIWWKTIQEYCDYHKLDEDQTEAMHFLVQQMDVAYLKHLEKKTKT
jgi:hypothetical protein